MGYVRAGKAARPERGFHSSFTAADWPYRPVPLPSIWQLHHSRWVPSELRSRRLVLTTGLGSVLTCHQPLVAPRLGHLSKPGAGLCKRSRPLQMDDRSDNGTMKRKNVLFALALVSAAIAQAQPTTSSVASTAKSLNTPSALALTEGEVERVDNEHGEVVINHGDLPNLGMGPMTMGFAVSDKRMLDSLKAGDKVRFQAEIKNGEATVTYIEPAQR